MKLGEIKLESLRLMAVNDETLSIENIKNYETDDLYKDYLGRMYGAINRAISRLMMFRVIPFKSVEILPNQCEIFSQYIKFNLKTNISDLNSIERIVYINNKGAFLSVNYQTLGDDILINVNDLPYFKNLNERFIVEYSPNVATITETTSNDLELEIPETLLRMIPYYVKGELYELDEPEISATARNIFENALSEYLSYGKPKKAKQNYIKNVMF
jgi:hypothetical protein